MAYDYRTRSAGDLILADDWNAIGQEILRLDAAKVDRAGSDSVNGPLSVRGNLEVGSGNQGASLRVLKKQEDGSDPAHGAIVLGTDTASSASLRLGYGAATAWLQSQGAQKALSMNPAGGPVGVGTDRPKSALSVAGALSVGASYASGNAAPENGLIVQGNVGIGTPAPQNRLQVEGGALGFGTATRQMINLVGAEYGIGVQSSTQYYRSGGHFAWFQGGAHNDGLMDPGGGRTLMSLRDGNLGVGTGSPTHKFHVLSGDAVGLFESTGGNAYLRLANNEGLDSRVEICNRGGGRFAVWTRNGGDSFNVTKEGNIGIGTTTPRSGIDLSNRIMTGAPNDYYKAQPTMSGGGTVAWGGPGNRLYWSNRFIAISMGRNSSFSDGHLNFFMPTGGIPAANVYDGANRLADGNGVLLNHWEALWGVHEVGQGAGAVSYRITRHDRDHTVPSNWVLIAVVNGDDSSIKLGTGEVILANGRLRDGWNGASLQSGWANYGAGYDNAAFRKDAFGTVSLRGLIKDGAYGWESTIFVLPEGYRPTAGRLILTTSVSAHWGRVDIMPDGRLLATGEGGGGQWLALDNISFSIL